MSTYNLRQFTRPETLRRIERDHLLRFLEPYRDFFERRGVSLPPPGDPGEINYEGLAEIFMSPDADTPPELVDALYFVHEMATEDGMDQLLEEVENREISLDQSEDVTPADFAIQLWLEDPDTLERKHAEQFLIRPRSFEYFQTDQEAHDLPEPPTRRVLEALEEDLDEWFESKRRGRGSRVFVYPRGEEYWFLVRHGDPYRREPSLEEGEPVTVFYRPEKYDIVVYNPVLGELRMNARSKGEKELYREKLGLHLFGEEDFFPSDGKYTLDPLHADGADSLVCSDIEGLEWIVLKEIQIHWGGPENEVEIRKANDLFQAFEARDSTLPDRRIQRAKFQVKFAEANRPRMVTIRPSNIAQYTRDSDGELVEEWLTRRGFVRSIQRADAAA